MHCKTVQEALKSQCGQLFYRLPTHIFLHQCKKLELYRFKNLFITMFCSSSRFSVSHHVLSRKTVFATLTSLMGMHEAYWNLSQCAPTSYFTKNPLYIQLKMSQHFVDFYFVFFTNGESNSQKEKNIGVSISVIKATQK